jgi:DNA-directed RNA polymerase subunit N (RpoN/RPB10)
MSELFHQYDQKFETLKDLMQDELPRNLRLFNLRLRLALDIQIDFKGEVSLTKTRDVRETYVKIIKLMEMWNAYESLFHYAKELGKYANPKANKAKIYAQSLLREVGSLAILKQAAETIKSRYVSNHRFKEDFDQYIHRIKKDDRIKSTLTDDALAFRAYCLNRKSISGIEILSLIYTERNMYYHNGETAKMGMRYSNRKLLIDTYRHCLIDHTLMLSNYILDAEIADNK